MRYIDNKYKKLPFILLWLKVNLVMFSMFTGKEKIEKNCNKTVKNLANEVTLQ